MTPTKVWLSEAVNTSCPSRSTGMYSIIMRFDKKEWDSSCIEKPVDIQYMEFPRSKEDHTPEVHLDIGIISEEGLLMLEQAIHEIRYGK